MLPSPKVWRGSGGVGSRRCAARSGRCSGRRQIDAAQIGQAAGDRGEIVEPRRRARGRRDQLCRIGVARAGEQRRGRRDLDDLAGMHDGDAVAIFGGERRDRA